MATYYLVSSRTGKKFEIIERDKAAGTVKLKGDIAEWDEPFDMEKFKKQGYTLVKEDD
jgi:hypothetical protein